MKLLLVLTLLIAACGSSGGSNGSATPGTPSNPGGGQGSGQITYTQAFTGVWKGLDYTLSFQDLLLLNSDGTGSNSALGFTSFQWTQGTDSSVISTFGPYISLTHVTGPGNANCPLMLDINGYYDIILTYTGGSIPTSMTSGTSEPFQYHGGSGGGMQCGSIYTRQ